MIDGQIFWRDASLEHSERGPIDLADKKLLLWLIRAHKPSSEGPLKQRDVDRTVAITKLAAKLARLWPEAKRVT